MKSLYKSDNSVLSQLGLTTGDVSPVRSEQLQYSPDTHFKPISTPENTAQQTKVIYLTPISTHENTAEQTKVIYLTPISTPENTAQQTNVTNWDTVFMCPRIKSETFYHYVLSGHV